jgi:hypothetical protein
MEISLRGNRYARSASRSKDEHYAALLGLIEERSVVRDVVLGVGM